MKRSVWKRWMAAGLAAGGSGLAAGCGAGVTEPVTAPPAQAPYQVSRPATPASNRPEGEFAAAPAEAEVSWETERDARFAKFLQGHSAGMVKKAAVGLENRGDLKVEITKAVEPEDTLALTKSLMAGARKDFPDKPVTVSLYDPQGGPILKARFRPGEGVHYQIAHGTSPGGAEGAAPAPKAAASGDPLKRGGVTERDQAFAAWAETHGKSMLRYVEADLEKHGRLWFGVTREVAPADVKPLTKSLLEGARKEFPKGDLVATVFDPEGERIGRAHLERSGEVRWEQ